MPLAPRPRALVTGAASGLGRALAVALASRGARVLAADLDLEGARETAEQVTRAGGEGHAAEADVTQAADVERLAREMDARFGGVDFVANNAGVAVAGPVGVVPLEDWRWAVGVNLWGVVHGCHVFVPRMRAQGAGHILNVASAAGLLSPPGLAPYNVTKAAVVSLSETLAGELYGSGVGVSVLCPHVLPHAHRRERARARRVAEEGARRADGPLEDPGARGGRARALRVRARRSLRLAPRRRQVALAPQAPGARPLRAAAPAARARARAKARRAGLSAGVAPRAAP